MFYKAPDNALHFIEPEFAHLLPAGSVPITEAEADAIRIASIKPPTTLEQIAALEAQVTPRRLREAALGDMAFIADIEAQISTLRSTL